MEEESLFLQRLLTNPDDLANRQAYASWLKDRKDPRALLFPQTPELDRINPATWLNSQGTLREYLADYPEWKPLAKQQVETARLRQKGREKVKEVYPRWLAFVDTLACPFQRFEFFDNSFDPSEVGPDELPFTERLGTRGAMLTLETSFRDEQAWDPDLLEDLGFLQSLELDECFYGAATCPVHPFLCELRTPRRPLTGSDVLAALHPRAFHSQVANQDATKLPYPGKHPGDGRGRHQDEIHNDFEAQYIFQNGPEEEEEEDEEAIDAETGTHGVLKRYVAHEQLWYVLLHTLPQPSEEDQFPRHAILLAVGLSPRGDRLLGVITHQDCHNLCD